MPTSSRSVAAVVLGSVSVLQAALSKPVPGMQIHLQTSGALSFPEVAAGPGKHFASSEQSILGHLSRPVCLNFSLKVYWAMSSQVLGEL